jgi:ACR3 family arsenite efflux pump ArsB
MKRFRNMSNDQLSLVILVMVVLMFVVSVIEPLAVAITSFVILVVLPVLATKSFAQFVDFCDDSIDLHREISPIYHLVYAIGFGFGLSIIVSSIAMTAIPLPADIIEALSPQLLFTAISFIFSLIGYAIAWQSIPNGGGKDES